jgi:hypothetical protein
LNDLQMSELIHVTNVVCCREPAWPRIKPFGLCIH